MPISPLPIAPNTADPDTFRPRADATFAALPIFITETNALAASFGPGAPFCTSGGTANAITLTTGLSLGSLVAGQSASWVAANDNTGATTLNIDSLGAVAAVTPLGAALPAGWINAGEIMSATYSGTAWVVYPSQAYLDAREATASLFDDAVTSTAAVDRVFGTAWRSIEIDIHNLVPATSGALLRMRLGNASAVMESATDDYEMSVNGGTGFNSTLLALSGAMNNTAGTGFSGTVKILGAQSATMRTRVQSDGGYEPSSGTFSEYRMRGSRRALVQHQSFSLFMSSGNLTIDRLTVRGVR